MIKSELHVYCDQCGAEGPHVEGPKRPALLAEIQKLGWMITDQCQHICMECRKVKPKVERKPDSRDGKHWTATVGIPREGVE